MNHKLNILILFVHIFLPVHTVTSAPAYSTVPLPSAAAVVNCTDELVTFSTCLPYVAVSPNNRSDSPSLQCCDDISNAFFSGSSVCLCYFVLRREILGFSLNTTKLMSLTSVCPLKDSDSNTTFSLESICSGTAPLPPLLSITGPKNTNPSVFGVNSPPPPKGYAEKPYGSPPNSELTDKTPFQRGFPIFPPVTSSAKGRIHIFSLTFLTFAVFVSASASRESPLDKTITSA